MKKLAIIGTSNSAIRHGYGKILKNKMPEECDVYGIGACTSLLGVFMLLKHNIVNQYEYVVFDFVSNETHTLYQNFTNQQTIVAYICFIAASFKNSASTPIFLILPNISYFYSCSASQLWNACGEIFNITVINIENLFKYIQRDMLCPPEDRNHYVSHYQGVIAGQIESAIQRPHAPLKYEVNQSIKFELLSYDKFGQAFSVESKITSLAAFDVAVVKNGSHIQIPENRRLAGLFYWNHFGAPYLRLKTKAITIAKNLNIKDKGFYIRGICQTYHGGYSGGELELSSSAEGAMLEPTYNGVAQINKSANASLCINSLVLADKSPYDFGTAFIKQYQPIFDKWKNSLIYIHQVRNRVESIPEKMPWDFFDAKVVNQSLNFYSDINNYLQKLYPMGKHFLKILDIGSRTGDGINFLGSLYRRNSYARITADVFACDVDMKFYHYATAYNNFITKYYLSDFREIDDKFDIIIASHTIEHVQDPVAFINDMRKKVTQHLIIYCPFMELEHMGSLIAGHVNNINRSFLMKFPVQNLEIFYSNVWHQSPVCMFALPPLAD